MNEEKKILFFVEQKDITSTKIHEWIKYHGHSVSTFTEHTDMEQFLLFLDNNYLHCNISKSINYDSVFIRRWAIPYIHFNSDKNATLIHETSKHLIEEWETTTKFILDEIYDGAPKTLGKHFNYTVNKLKALSYAKKIGLRTPNTIIVKGEIAKQNPETIKKAFITKPIFEFFNASTPLYEYSYTGVKTIDITQSTVANFPSLLQERIDKKIEIRTFFFKEEYFSMAMFSQTNEKTKEDYRNYDQTKPNRVVPFKLPSIIIEKLKILMRKLELDTGSIDIIYSTSNEFVFLEVNPEGQLDWLSHHCNYYIEEKIAQFLTKA